MEEKQVTEEKQSELNLEDVKGVESEGIDLNKFDKKEVSIEIVEPMQVPSNYTALAEDGVTHLKQWVLKVASEVLETIGEDDAKIEFRASELFNLIQDTKGNLKSFPKGDSSNLGKFVRDLKIDVDSIDNLKQLQEVMKGKKTLVKAYEVEKEVDGKSQSRTYLKFRY